MDPPPSQSTLDFERMDLRECHCTDVLNLVYPQLVRHWRAACHTVKAVHFLSEAGSAALATGNNMQVGSGRVGLEAGRQGW